MSHPLLHLLDAWVRSQQGATGFAGKICLGVRTSTSFDWWTAEVHYTGTQARFVNRPDLEADVLALLDADQAGAVLRGERVKNARISGDAELFRRFVDRYVRPRNAIDLRAS